MSIALEIAVTTPDEAVAAERAGADRLELCSALEVGGVTPRLETFASVRELVRVPVFVLLRPRDGEFVFSEKEIALISRDAKAFRRAGADGLVFGALKLDGRIAMEVCRRVVELAGGQATFHRAFDCLARFPASLEDVVALGFTRVLTSGGAPTASAGIPAIADLVARAAGRITVVAGGGVRPGHAAAIVRATGCTEVHSAARAAGATVTDPAIVAALRSELNRLP